MKINRIKILVVEDDPTYLSFWKRFIDQLGFEIVAASSFEEIFPKIDTLNCKLMICDIILPGKNGYQLLDAILKKYPNMPAMLTTAYGSKVSRFSCHNKRFHLLHKPFKDLEKLTKLIIHLVAEESVFDDADEESFSDNIDYPEITEWTF